MNELRDLILTGGVIAVVVILALLVMWGAATAVTGAFLMWAWNILLVPVAHLAPLGFWQGVAGSILLQMVSSIFRSHLTKKES